MTMLKIQISPGSRFTRLEVLAEIPARIRPSGRRERLFECRCDCGTVKAVTFNSLRSRGTKSCGCLISEKAATRCKTLNLTHGDSRAAEKAPEYRAWECAHQRCTNPNNASYRYYGAQGIRVCRRWKSYENFLKDMGRKPYPKATLDRIDNAKDYGPKNCKWSSKRDQANNRSSNVQLEIGGVTKTIAQWCRVYDLNYETVRARLRVGWPLHRVFNERPRGESTH